MTCNPEEEHGCFKCAYFACEPPKEYLLGSHRNTSVSDAVAVDLSSGDLAQYLD